MSIVVPERSQVAILSVDFQCIDWTGVDLPQEPELARTENLFLLADWMDLPTIAVFEHPVDRNGMFPERLEKVFPARGLGASGRPGGRKAAFLSRLGFIRREKKPRRLERRQLPP